MPLACGDPADVENNTLHRLKMAAKILGSQILGCKYLGPKYLGPKYFWWPPQPDRRQGIGVMSAFLLLLGAVTTAAGLALVTSGATGAFDAEIVTPGTVAAVGGLLLIGLGLTVRALQRIERALESRPMPRRVRSGEAPGAAVAERAEEAPQIPFPARPRPNAGSRVAAASATPADEAAIERLREKFQTLVRLENAPAVEEADVSLLPPAPAAAQANGGAAINGGAATHATATQARMPPPAHARASGSSARPKGSMFDTFWPKGPRPRKDGEETAAQASPPPAERLEANEALDPEPRPLLAEEPESPAQAAVSVIKSGVVEGRAYTLYSDGSIEAQFPQGMMRFRSIGELRNHIESSS